MKAPEPPPEYDDLKCHDMPMPNAVYYSSKQQQPMTSSQNAQVTAVFQVLPYVGRESTTLVCPACKATVSTQVRYTNCTFTYMMSLFLFGIPLCFNAFKDACHYCPKCNAFIGTHKRM
uniref:LITAF domain-containing protein n=1 Tax=Panagrellus redivivus TaxID=6233 RepID=A0A7E4VDJ8_PANRE